MKKFRVYICFFIGILLPFVGHSTELGVFPFENQRNNSQQNWLGYYIQYRLESSLFQQTGLIIKPLSFLRLWQFNANNSDTPPASDLNPKPFFLISGSYQKVFDTFYLQVNLTDNLKNVIKSKEIEIPFKDLDKELDHLLADICGSFVKKWNIESKELLFSADMQPLFELREYLYKPGIEISPDLFYCIYSLMDKYPSIIFKRDLIKGLLVFSRLNLNNNGTRYLNLAESWIRKFLKEEEKDSFLNAYLAEIFYLKDFDKAFIEKLSLSAIKFDSTTNALPYLLLSLTKGLTAVESEGYLKKLDEINPWIIPEDHSDKVQFQHGILTHYIIENFNQASGFEENE